MLRRTGVVNRDRRDSVASPEAFPGAPTRPRTFRNRSPATESPPALSGPLFARRSPGRIQIVRVTHSE